MSSADSYFYARSLVMNGKVKRESDSDAHTIMLVDKKFRVFFKKHKREWSCECLAYCYNTPCCHVLACEIFLFGNPAKPMIEKE